MTATPTGRRSCSAIHGPPDATSAGSWPGSPGGGARPDPRRHGIPPVGPAPARGPARHARAPLLGRGPPHPSRQGRPGPARHPARLARRRRERRTRRPGTRRARPDRTRTRQGRRTRPGTPVADPRHRPLRGRSSSPISSPASRPGPGSARRTRTNRTHLCTGECRAGRAGHRCATTGRARRVLSAVRGARPERGTGRGPAPHLTWPPARPAG